jgi:hypothetical protein
MINSLTTVPVAVDHYSWYRTLGAWGNIGSLLGGLAAPGLATVALLQGTAGLGDWRARQRAERDLADEQAENIRLDRERVLHGWSPGGVEVYGVSLVTEPIEMDQAKEQLLGGGPTDYAIVRVNESPFDNTMRALSLRQLASRGYLARPPERGEYEALELGRSALLQRPATSPSQEQR